MPPAWMPAMILVASRASCSTPICEEHPVAAGARLQFADPRAERALVLHRIDARQVGRERCAADFFDGIDIHAGGEVVADLLLSRCALGSHLRRVLEDAPEVMLIVVVELAVHAPARLVRGNGIVLLPAPAGIRYRSSQASMLGVDRRRIKTRSEASAWLGDPPRRRARSTACRPAPHRPKGDGSTSGSSVSHTFIATPAAHQPMDERRRKKLAAGATSLDALFFFLAGSFGRLLPRISGEYSAAACLAVTLTHAASASCIDLLCAGESRREFRRAQVRTLPGALHLTVRSVALAAQVSGHLSRVVPVFIKEP